MSRYTDGIANKFQKTNLFYSDDFLKFQDPTYLGFKLFFLFDQPDSGLLSEKPHKHTALGYLESRGETQRAKYLKEFVRLFKRISSETPWFFQSIKGLDEAWKHGFGNDDFKSKIKEGKITIDCLDESVDLRITALLDLYRKSCFDWNYRREIVPRNLRQFQVSIYVYEARNINRWGFPFKISLPSTIESSIPSEFKKGKIDIDKLMGEDPFRSPGLIEKAVNIGRNAKSIIDGTYSPGENLEQINPNISRLLFRFSFCEFLPDESGTFVSEISYKEMKTQAQQIVFSYGNVTEDNIYRMFSDSLVTDSFVTAMDILSSDNRSLFKNPISDSNLPSGISAIAEETVNRAIRETAAKAITEINNKAKGLANNLFLGNVYGFSGASVVGGFTSGIGGFTSLMKRTGDNKSLKNETKKSNDKIPFETSTSIKNAKG